MKIIMAATRSASANPARSDHRSGVRSRIREGAAAPDPALAGPSAADLSIGGACFRLVFRFFGRSDLDFDIGKWRNNRVLAEF